MKEGPLNPRQQLALEIGLKFIAEVERHVGSHANETQLREAMKSAGWYVGQGAPTPRTPK